MKALARSFIAWLPLAVAIAGLSLSMYAAVQQEYRKSLDDPQIQIAEDAAAKLADGGSVEAIVPEESVDIGKSLAPWVAVYDASGAPVRSSGMLAGAMPKLPQGVFAASKANAGKATAQPHEDRITWQPQSGVRQALVVEYVDTPAGIAYVAAGRSMREVESRESELVTIVGTVMLALLATTLLLSYLADRARRMIS